MPLLRRPHDHRREFPARWRTPRPALAPSRAQDRNAMTPITASSHLPPAGEPRFGVTPLSPRRLQLHALYRRSGQNRPVDRRRAKLATTIVDPPPITLASASTTQA